MLKDKSKRCIEKYGISATLKDFTKGNAEITEFKALVQALRYKNKVYLRGTYTEIGKNQQDYYLYIGPGDVDISNADGVKKTLTIGGVEYITDRTEKHYIGDENIYVWGIIRPVVL